MIHTGRHFLQIPGPTNVPDRVLRAIDRPVIDHRGPEFAKLGMEVLENIRPVFQTTGPVIIYPGSGTGAWEAAIVNTLSPGDRVLMFETGHFSLLWSMSQATGAAARRPRNWNHTSLRINSILSKRSWSFTTKPQPELPAGSPKFAAP